MSGPGPREVRAADAARGRTVSLSAEDVAIAVAVEQVLEHAVKLAIAVLGPEAAARKVDDALREQWNLQQGIADARADLKFGPKP